jgi:putative ABC transport system substrate-binding protein
MYGAVLFVEARGLMFYGPPYADLYGRAAAVVAKVLNGTKPADIPVEQPITYKLLINGKTAKTLGITIPQSVLMRAETIETLEP